MYICHLLRFKTCCDPSPSEWAGSGNPGKVCYHSTNGSFFSYSLFTVIMNNFPPFFFFFFFIQLEVEVTDLSGKVIDGPVRLDISVIDQNDNRPMFKEGPYVGHVMEGSPTGKSMPVIYLYRHTEMKSGFKYIQFCEYLIVMEA